MEIKFKFTPLLHKNRGVKIKSCAYAVMLCMLCGGLTYTPASYADYYDNDNILIPDIGTAGSLGLSVQKEKAIGDYFMRAARSMMPVIDDPVLTEYVNTLGNRLLSKADNVLFPFSFFIVNDQTLNASAFLGGKVVINTGLFKYADTEDEFASVIAHEITHVTQRHLARFIEKVTASSRLSTAGLIGAVAMSILNPAIGIAAMSTSVGIGAQTRINFTRDNEYEADRLGIALLYKAGLNPQGTVDMFNKLYQRQGNINPAFTLLIDHPLSDERVAEAKNRIAHYQKRKNSTNPNFDFAKARVLVRFSNTEPSTLKQLFLTNPHKYSQNLVNYGLALACFELKEYQQAREYLNRLKGFDNNLFIIDLKTDLDLSTNQSSQAISRLQAQYKRLPLNQVIVANLASAYIETKQYNKAKELLNNYIRHKPTDVLALNLLDQTYTALKDSCNALQTKGEVFALSADYGRAISLYNQSLRVCTDHLERERIKARVAQIATQRAFDEDLQP